MINTYLLQRATKTFTPSRKGIDKIISFDYMGSAEFEFGALPKSLGRIRGRFSDFQYTEHEINGLKITLFADKELSQFFDKWLVELKHRRVRLKEGSRFSYYFSDDNKWLPDFWWSLDEDFMFWLSDDDFKSKFKNII